MVFSERSLAGIVLVWVTATGCAEPAVHGEELELRAGEGRFYRQGRPFSGVAVLRHPNGDLRERSRFADGRRHGERRKWFEHGQTAFVAHYRSGKLDGTSMTWWRNGRRRSLSNYAEGKQHGKQLRWYVSGALFKELNIVAGREVGLQRAWRENGKLFANYEAKDGRNYGLKRAGLCFRLEDEIVQLED